MVRTSHIQKIGQRRDARIAEARSNCSTEISKANQEFADAIRRELESSTATDVCSELGISRQVFYKILRRHPKK